MSIAAPVLPKALVEAENPAMDQISGLYRLVNETAYADGGVQVFQPAPIADGLIDLAITLSSAYGPLPQGFTAFMKRINADKESGRRTGKLAFECAMNALLKDLTDKITEAVG